LRVLREKEDEGYERELVRFTLGGEPAYYLGQELLSAALKGGGTGYEKGIPL